MLLKPTATHREVGVPLSAAPGPTGNYYRQKLDDLHFKNYATPETASRPQTRIDVQIVRDRDKRVYKLLEEAKSTM